MIYRHRSSGLVALNVVLIAMLALLGTACESDDGGGGRPGSSSNKDSSGGGDAVSETLNYDSTGDGACAADCTAKACGDDGCGGSCGGCATGLTCAQGACIDPSGCAPVCAGKACGPDGCGGDCGSCYNAQGAVDQSLCSPAGACVDPSCVPVCAGKACGPDSCGGECGLCHEGQSCQAGACVGGSTDDCDRDGFTKVSGEAKLEASSGGNVLLVSQQDAQQPPTNLLSIENYMMAPYNGPNSPGVYDLVGQNYADCGLCLLGRTGCTNQGCEKTFFMKEGSLEIVEFSGSDAPFKAVINATLEEVTINTSTYQSTPVPGGQTWCLENVIVDEFVPDNTPKPTEAECVANGTGTLLGANIANFTLQNCYGEPASLHDKCGTTKMVWFTAVAGWCPACAEWLPQVSDAIKQLKSQGVKMEHWTVLGEDVYGNVPSAAFCESFATEHGMDPKHTYIDFQYATLFSKLEVYAGSDGSFGVPWDAMLDGDNMSYYWCAQSSTEDVNAALNHLAND